VTPLDLAFRQLLQVVSPQACDSFQHSSSKEDTAKFQRFWYLESLKLKGKPRAAMFNLIPEDWGGYVMPWVNKITESFIYLKLLHFQGMIVRDLDLELVL
jgi:hypothetical protein